METIEFKTNLRCSDCITKVAPFLNTVIGKDHWKVELDHPDKMVTVSVADPGDAIKVQAAFEKAGYTAERKSVSELFAEKNELIKKGAIVEASEKFFAADLKTLDHTGMVTNNKAEMMEKMKGFAGSIKTVNGITLHFAVNNELVSLAEWTFDFDMKDGSKIYWHEIIRSVWMNGQIIEEQYFKG